MDGSVQSWISTVVGAITAFGVIFNIVQNVRSKRDIRELTVNTNSIKDELVKVTGEKMKAEGVLEGRAEEKRANA